MIAERERNKMKISRKITKENPLTQFNTMSIGTVFSDPSMTPLKDNVGSEEIFMKVGVSASAANAISLNDGDTWNFAPLDQIKVEDAEVVIKVTE
jgi:hypothetical protein